MAKITTKEILISSFDNLKLTASLIKNKNGKPFVLFCHQEKMNKFEFSGIAEDFNKLGFNTLTLDMRFGGALGKEISGTKENAIANKKSTDAFEGEKDIIAAVDYLVKKYEQKVILFGSGIGASLVLHVASKHKKLAAAIAFSPTDCFVEKLGSLRKQCAKIKVPTFVTGEKSKNEERTDFLLNLMHEQFMHFEPASKGLYGAQILWKYQRNNQEFWDALLNFVERLQKMRFYK